MRGCTNPSWAALRTNSQVPKIGRPSWEPGITRQEVTFGAATNSALLLRRLLSGGTPRTFCRSTAESLGREATFFPRPGSIPFTRQPHDSRSGAESAYLPGRTQTVAILPTQGLTSSRPPQFLLRSPTDSSYSAVLSLASETRGTFANFGFRPVGWTLVRQVRRTKVHPTMAIGPALAAREAVNDIARPPHSTPRTTLMTANFVTNGIVFHDSRPKPIR